MTESGSLGGDVVSYSGNVIDEMVDHFSREWVAGRRQPVEMFLQKTDPVLQGELLQELLLMELELRIAGGERPQMAEYRERFPGFRREVARVFEEYEQISQARASAASSRPPGGNGPSAGDHSTSHGGRADESSLAFPKASVSPAEFCRQLADQEMIPREFLKTLDDRPERSVRGLARELIRERLLTRFQAERLLRGAGLELRVGKYVLEDLLGEGGMGKVYRGRNPRLKQPVAIKELSAKLTDNEQAVQRFQREIRLSARASHPNLVTALDAEEHEGRLYLVMEYVAGQDLSRFVKDHGPLSVSEAVESLCQAAEGLRAAHDLGILHRDIKPGNLMRTTSGQVKVLDLGLASCQADGDPGQNADQTALQLTGTGMFLGTPDYMSPEQATDGRLTDARSDLYSLGCTLYYLLVGHPPYYDQSGVRKLMAHSSLPIPSLQSARPDVPSGLEKVYQRLMAKVPGDRYGSCAELLDDLRRLQALGLSTKPSRPRSEEPLAVAPPGAVVEPDGTPWPVLQLDEARSPTRTSHARASTKDRRSPWVLWGAVTAVPLVILSGLWLLIPAPRQIVRIAVDPPDAVARLLDGAGQQAALGSARKSVVELRAPAGTYTLEIARDGFESQRQEITLPMQGNALEKPVRLVRSEGAIIREEEPENLALWYHTPEYTAWIEKLRLLDGGRQLEEVRRKIQELNPEAKASLNPDPPFGTPKSLHMNPVGLRDLSPLRAIRELPFLATIRSLNLGSNEHYGIGTIEDLSPLQGLRLEGLDLSFNSLKRISPLRGMPLVSLSLGNTNVVDLEPLAECRQLKYLSLFRSQCQSLEPLRPLRLETLILEETPHDFANLEPLKDMTSLRHINLRLNKSVKGLFHLEKVPLVSLVAQECQKLESLEGLNTTELQVLNIEGSPITSLEPLAGAQRLQHLNASLTGISDLRPLGTVTSLQSLSVRVTPVMDLSPLKLLPQLKQLVITLPETVQGPLWNQVQGLSHLENLNNQPWDPAKPTPR